MPAGRGAQRHAINSTSIRQPPFNRGGCAINAERHAVFVRGEVGVCATNTRADRQEHSSENLHLALYLQKCCQDLNAAQKALFETKNQAGLQSGLVPGGIIQ